MTRTRRPAGSGVRQRLGALGEDLAAAHLRELGWRIESRNWRCPVGEIDLVAVEPDGTVVFCEVKTRRGLGFGDPLESITWAKQRKLRELAACWLREQPTPRARIDAVGVLLTSGRAPSLRHVRGVA